MRAAEELVQTERIVTRNGHVFQIDGAVLNHFELGDRMRRAARPVGPLTADLERKLLGIIGRDASSQLFHRAAMMRSELTFDSGGGQEDRFARAIEDDRGLGVLCRLLALRGSSACIDEQVRSSLLSRGFRSDQIDAIATQLSDHAKREQYHSWRIGPSYEQIVGLLADAGVDPNQGNIARLRRNALFLLAHVLEDVDRRYERSAPHVAEVYADIVADESCNGLQATARRSVGVSAAAANPRLIVEPGVSVRDRTPVDLAGPITGSQPAARQEGSTPSFLGLVESLVLRKTTGTNPNWDIKTAKQHRSIAKLFVKITGSDDPRAIKQSHVGGYFTKLALLPKHYGKSSKDEGRTIDEILARNEDLDEDEIGLEAGTVNRHQTQLGNILQHMKGNGFDCGEALPTFRRSDTESYEVKRGSYSLQDGTAYFSTPVCLGCKGPNDRLEFGSIIIHDALFWVPLIAWYALLRLSEITGLLLSDIDTDARVFIIADNALRRVKSAQSRRRIPIHPELLRLGFIEYVILLRTLGHTLLFPDLRMRGDNTPLSCFFYKSFRPVLAWALPHASEQRITLHSTRKTGNTAMIEAGIIDAVRLRIMGHKLPGVNGKHYTAKLSDDTVLAALLHIPVVTQAMKPFPIQLAPGVTTITSDGVS